MMKRLEWHFNDYPAVDEESKISCAVIVKLTDGNLRISRYVEGHDNWTNVTTGEQVCCWACIGYVPETTTPMPKKR